MKNQHVTLSGLQVAAATFLAARAAQAGKVFCADANNKVVPDAKCDGTAPPETFFMFSSEQELAAGSTIDANTSTLHDSSEAFRYRHAVFPADVPFQEFESGGFGRRQNPDCDNGG
ncbi:hypothetical protein C8034_v000811 [Colletotrichum sidae]|uniref:Uncharacterized protein n=1 Tax=Colletotrichum sidae TaxID=1347389 RepID=A0A4R8TF43_9PEZI|nr:hypothetical protein C8034_v000811 [Colletotrichum sidae]